MSPKTQTLSGQDACQILEQASTRNTILQARASGVSHSCETRIRSIHLRGGRMDIDAFGIPDMDARMSPDADVEILFVVNHTSYRFATKCLEFDEGIAHRLRIPREIEILQRRAYFRMEPPCGQSVLVDAQYRAVEDTRSIEVVNLSVGGVLVYDRMLVAAPETDHLLSLRLQFEEGDELKLEGRVRRVSPHPKIDRGLLLGIRFDGTSATTELLLNQIIMRWQRESQRRKSKKV